MIWIPELKPTAAKKQVKDWTQNWNPTKRLSTGSFGSQLVYVRPFIWLLCRSVGHL